jgi:hypothetical protein
MFWLERRNIPVTDDVVDRLLRIAKASDHTLSEAEILECVPEAAKLKYRTWYSR